MIVMLFRLYSCLFAFLLGLFMSGVSLLLLLSGAGNFRFDMLPYLSGRWALCGLLVLGVLGILAAWAGFTRKMRSLLLAYLVLVFALMLYGYFISPVYRFQGRSDFLGTVWLALAALLAVAGAFIQYREPSRA